MKPVQRETRSGNFPALCTSDKELVWSYREEKECGWGGGEGVVRWVLGLGHSGGGKWGPNEQICCWG